MKFWAGKLYSSKSGGVRITDQEIAIFFSEYSRRKSLSSLGIMVNEAEISEIFLEAFGIIDSELTKLQNIENNKRLKKSKR